MPRKVAGKLLIVSAPSGAGKTTLCQRLLREFPDRMVFSISCTTRKPRHTEEDGRDYHFLTEAEFKRRIAAGEFAEWAEVHHYFYGTLKSTILEATRKGLTVVLDIDVQGADSLRRAFPKLCVPVFISPPDLQELKRRLATRATDDPSIIQTRIANAEREMSRIEDFDFVIVNDNLDRAYDDLRSLVRQRIFDETPKRPRKKKAS